jgi:hypothetical protein
MAADHQLSRQSRADISSANDSDFHYISFRKCPRVLPSLTKGERMHEECFEFPRRKEAVDVPATHSDLRGNVSDRCFMVPDAGKYFSAASKIRSRVSAKACPAIFAGVKATSKIYICSPQGIIRQPSLFAHALPSVILHRRHSSLG